MVVRKCACTYACACVCVRHCFALYFGVEWGGEEEELREDKGRYKCWWLDKGGRKVRKKVKRKVRTVRRRKERRWDVSKDKRKVSEE